MTNSISYRLDLVRICRMLNQSINQSRLTCGPEGEFCSIHLICSVIRSCYVWPFTGLCEWKLSAHALLLG